VFVREAVADLLHQIRRDAGGRELALLANDVVGWVPVASGGGAITVLSALARWVVIRRRRQHDDARTVTT
jgi:hypothetical protein